MSNLTEYIYEGFPNDKYNPTPVGFARVNKQPLDKYEYFESMEDFINYVKHGPVYNGQVCKVKICSGLTTRYLINMYTEGDSNFPKITPLHPESSDVVHGKISDLIGNIQPESPAGNSSLVNEAIGANWILIYHNENTKRDSYESKNINYSNDSLLFSNLCDLDIYRITADGESYFNFLAHVVTFNFSGIKLREKLYVITQVFNPLTQSSDLDITTQNKILLNNSSTKEEILYFNNDSDKFSIFPLDTNGEIEFVSLYVMEGGFANV